MPLPRTSSKSLYHSENKDKHKAQTFSTVQDAKNHQTNFLNTIKQSSASRSMLRYQSFKDSLIREPHQTQMNFSCPRLLRSEEKASHSHESKEKSSFILKYNKWYIKPSLRLKSQTDRNSGHSKNRSKTQSYELYNNLYKQYSADQQNPLQATKNKNMENLDNISIDNVVILQKFKESLEKGKKRVPKIVNVFIERKFKQLQNEKKS